MHTKESRSIIHIGYPKTGTTWFQEKLFPRVHNAEYLDQNLIKEEVITPYHFFYKPSDVLQQMIDNKRVIVSEESLLGCAQDGGMQFLHTKEMGYRLKSLFPNGQIIIFLRNQVSLIASAYHQYIRVGGNYSVKDYLFDRGYSFNANRRLFSFDFFRFDEVIAFYQKLFGDDQVFIYLYEEFAQNPQSFVTQFATNHNLDVDFSEIDFKPVNRRFGGMIWFSKFINSFTKRPIANKYYLIHIPYWRYISDRIKVFLSSTRLTRRGLTDEKILGKETCIYIREYFLKSNEALATSLNLREKFEEHGYL